MNKIEIPIKPKPAPRITHQGRFTKSAKAYYSYKDYLKLFCNANDFIISEKVKITFFIPIGKSISKKETALRLGNPHKLKPDLDNLCKGVWDALATEDGFIHYAILQKVWSLEGKIVIENL